MWDFEAVDDPDVNRRLGALSLQLANAPVNVVVAYGRELSEEGWANVQSASAAIENTSLAAHVLGLGTFWITQMGDREKVRETAWLPEDRFVVAVLVLGYVNRSSFHDATEWMRGRRGGPRGVEYVLAPDPNIGPFQSLEPAEVERLCAAAGLAIEGRVGSQAVPPREEIEFRTRRFLQRGMDSARIAGWFLSKVAKLPGLESRRGRFQFLRLRRRETVPSD